MPLLGKQPFVGNTEMQGLPLLQRRDLLGKLWEQGNAALYLRQIFPFQVKIPGQGWKNISSSSIL